jgi:hypothetical protein
LAIILIRLHLPPPWRTSAVQFHKTPPRFTLTLFITQSLTLSDSRLLPYASCGRDHPSPDMTSTHEPQSPISKKRKASELGENADFWCEHCASMIGTLRGLRLLFSAEGYRHYTLEELRSLAEGKCSCCAFVVNRLKSIPRRWDDSSVLYFRSPYCSERFASLEDKEFEQMLKTNASFNRPSSGFQSLELYINSHQLLLRQKTITTFFLYNKGKFNNIA